MASLFPGCSVFGVVKRMKWKTVTLGLLLPALAVAVASCSGQTGAAGPISGVTPLQTPESVPTLEPTVNPHTWNVASELDLRSASRIEIFELAIGGPGYLRRAVISDPDAIDDVVQSLDRSLGLQTSPACPDSFRLRFVFEGGQSERNETLGLVCSNEPALVRVDASVTGFAGALLPQRFRSTLQHTLAIERRLPAVASDRIVPEAISQVLAVRPDLAEYVNFEYEREDLSEAQEDGTSSFAYRSPDWLVEVSHEDVAEPVYSVSVRSVQSGFQWEGEIEAADLTRPPLITPADAVIADRVLKVVLDKLRSEDVLLASLPDDTFQRWDLTPVGTPEGSPDTFHVIYMGRHWEVEVMRSPAGLPAESVDVPVFNVTVRIPGEGFKWQGEVLLSQLEP